MYVYVYVGIVHCHIMSCHYGLASRHESHKACPDHRATRVQHLTGGDRGCIKVC